MSSDWCGKNRMNVTRPQSTRQPTGAIERRHREGGNSFSSVYSSCEVQQTSLHRCSPTLQVRPSPPRLWKIRSAQLSHQEVQKVSHKPQTQDARSLQASGRGWRLLFPQECEIDASGKAVLIKGLSMRISCKGKKKKEQTDLDNWTRLWESSTASKTGDQVSSKWDR